MFGIHVYVVLTMRHEQLCFLSRPLWQCCVPRCLRFDHRIQNDEEFAHRCRERHLLCFASRQEPLVERFDDGVTACGGVRSQHKLLGKMVGGMLPAFFGCRTPSELGRVRGWDTPWPTRRRGALPKRSWLKRL